MNSLRSFFETIRLEHTLFALPFAYATLFLAENGWPTTRHFVWITLAMVAARTVGMAMNRVIDAGIDARNPRTAGRAIPAGRLSRAMALVFTLASLAVFLVAVYRLHPLCRRLWPIVIAAMVAYPYTKRFTPLTHLFLGVVYFMVPTAVWLALTGELPMIAIVLGIGAALWVAGFDIIYACQDAEVDRREGLHSLPADFGVAPALHVAQWFHAGFVVALVVVSQMFDAGRWYYAGVAITSLAMAYEHRLVTPNDLSRVNAAFFTTNGFVSVALFALIALDTVLQ